MSSSKTYPAALTIAGSDSGGGAGIQADLRTFSANGVFGCSAITAVTYQNPHGVYGIFPVSAEGVSAQIRAVLSDFSIRAVKTGMLFSAEIIRTVVQDLAGFNGKIVVDPVMVSTSGCKLLRDDAVAAVQELLLPRAAWITPNIPEAEVLTGMTIRSEEDMRKAALCCLDKFHAGIVVKGGHAHGGRAVDLACDETGRFFTLETERLELPDLTSHGTGCTFSSAIAAGLAKGLDDETAVRNAKHFVFTSLASAVRTGEKVWSMFPERLKNV